MRFSSYSARAIPSNVNAYIKTPGAARAHAKRAMKSGSSAQSVVYAGNGVAIRIKKKVYAGETRSNRLGVCRGVRWHFTKQRPERERRGALRCGCGCESSKQK